MSHICRMCSQTLNIPAEGEMSDALHDRDVYAWASQLGEADIENIAEEIECSGTHELVNRLSVMLPHSLNWVHQPSLRGNGRHLSIENRRNQLADHLDNNPSLKLQLNQAMYRPYRCAASDASIETGSERNKFRGGTPSVMTRQ